MSNDGKVDSLAKTLWDYGLMHQRLEKADVIVVFGSYNPMIAKRAAELYKQGYAPVVVFSGNRSDATSNWEKTEAETLAEVAMEDGLPKENILLETKATNSGENTRFTRELLQRSGIDAKKIIAVQKPYAERRVYATIRKQWPEVSVMVTSPNLTYEQYLETAKSKQRTISVMVGDIQRIKIYAEKGFQIPQEIPENVWQAYEELVELGYGGSLVR